MKITKSKLKMIIKEEIEMLLVCGGDGSGMKLSDKELKKRRKQRDRSDDSRRKMISYMGGRDMVDLSKGHLVEDPAEDGCVGNHNFDEMGRFTNPKDAATWSRRDKSCKKNGQYQKRYKGVSSAPCGRGERKRCKDNTNKYEESLDKTDDEYLDLLYRYEALQIEFEKVSKELKQEKSRKSNGMDLSRCVKTINGIVQSTKGDLGKKD